jgi:chaperonin cofactor prefoldin
MPITEYAVVAQQEIHSRGELFKEKLQVFQEAKQSVESELREVSKVRKEIDMEINQKIDKIVGALEERRRELLLESEIVYEEKCEFI